MEQKFVKFEEALDKLGITADRLNQLREDGELRAYRDGASWKFRSDEIDRMASDGVPEPAPPSDIGLVDRSELVDSSPLESLPELDSEFALADLDDDTVTAGGSDAVMELASDEPSDPSDSILLSEEALGESITAPPSTIIGKSELESEDADLELVTDDEGSDVSLASGSGASDVLSAGIAGSGVLDDVEREGGNTSAFEKLEELEIDLAAESSRILTPEDVAEVQAKSAPAPKKPSKQGDSDLTLKDVELAGEDEGTDPVVEELETAGNKKKKKDVGPTSDLELATGDDDDFVLAEAGGSDITLDSGDSGINLIDPSDSGLALDDIPLEMGGSAILESLSLGDIGGGESEISLVGSDVGEKAPKAAPKGGKPGKQAAAIQTDDDFRLTPLGEGEDDGDSSSQVIALDADMGDLGAGDAGILGGDAFTEELGDDAGLTEEYAAEEGGFEASPYTGAVAARSDSEYSVMNIVALTCCAVLLLLCVTVSLDVIRNIWSWDSNLALNDSLLESLLGLFGLS
jgi:hypothetical protein